LHGREFVLHKPEHIHDDSSYKTAEHGRVEPCIDVDTGGDRKSANALAQKPTAIDMINPLTRRPFQHSAKTKSTVKCG
jgi:hypothetical protein